MYHLCIILEKQFEEAVENAQWRKFKGLALTLRSCLSSFIFLQQPCRPLRDKKKTSVPPLILTILHSASLVWKCSPTLNCHLTWTELITFLFLKPIVLSVFTSLICLLLRKYLSL